MRWRIGLLTCMFASAASASSWVEDGRNLTIENNEQSLIVTCESIAYHPALIKAPRVYYKPSCPDECYIGDSTRLASIVLDDTPFPVDLWGSDQPEFGAKARTLDVFLKKLETAQQIAIYGPQVTPHYVEFAIDNPEALADFNARCTEKNPK